MLWYSVRKVTFKKALYMKCREYKNNKIQSRNRIIFIESVKIKLMDVITQFYVDVRIQQMLSYLTYCHANNFDNIPFIEKTTLIYTPLSTLMPINANENIKRVVAPICLHFLDCLNRKNIVPAPVVALQKFSIFYNESLNAGKSVEERNKRSLVYDIGDEMDKLKKKKLLPKSKKIDMPPTHPPPDPEADNKMQLNDEEEQLENNTLITNQSADTSSAVKPEVGIESVTTSPSNSDSGEV